MDQSPQVTPEPTKEKRAAPAFVPLILAGLFMVTGICVLLFIGREKARIIGQTITELDIQPLLNADKAITQEAMKGKVVVLHFWGYWNRPSATEYPDFFQLQTKYNADSDVLFASIACSDRTNDTKDSLAFYSKKFLGNLSDPNALNLPVYYDPAEFTRTQISQLLTAGGFTYPTTIVVDGAGQHQARDGGRFHKAATGVLDPHAPHLAVAVDVHLAPARSFGASGSQHRRAAHEAAVFLHGLHAVG